MNESGRIFQLINRRSANTLVRPDRLIEGPYFPSLFINQTGASEDDLITDINLYNDNSACDYGALNETLVKGKMVYCLGSGGQDYYIRQLGGVGLIMATERTDVAFPFLIPAAFVTTADGHKIDQYINTTQ